MLPPDSKTSPSQLKRGKETFSNVWLLNLGAGVGHTSETEGLLEPGSFESHRLKRDFLVSQNPLLMRYSLISIWTQTEKNKLEKKYQSMFKKQQTSKIKQGIYGYCLENLFKNSISSLRGRMLVFLKY